MSVLEIVGAASVPGWARLCSARPGGWGTDGRDVEGLEPGRAMLYVCGECQDLGCGAVTCQVDITAASVVWRDFCWERGFGEPGTPLPGGPWTFDAVAYRALIAATSEAVTSV